MTFAAIPANLKPHLQHRLLSADEELLLVIKAQSSDVRARNRLLRHNLRFAVEQTKNLCECYLHLDFDEGFDAAIIGLNKAIDGFDPTLGFRLSTYAYTKVLYEIQKLMAKVVTYTKHRSDKPVEELELSHQPLPLEQLERQERLTELRQKRRDIWGALRNFPKQIRKLIVWRLLGHSYKDLGERFGFSRQTASNYYQKYFPCFLQALFPAQVCTPPRRSLRRLLTRRTPKLRLTTATVRPKRSHRTPQNDLTSKECRWPQVLRKISRSASVAITPLLCKLQHSKVNSRSSKPQVAILRRAPQLLLAAATRLFSTVFQLRPIAQSSNSELPSATVGLQEVRGSPGSSLAGRFSRVALLILEAVPPDSLTIQLSDRIELQQSRSVVTGDATPPHISRLFFLPVLILEIMLCFLALLACC
ncbi:RNA polymerase sigma factor RpoS [Acaryochloris thomasi RCC1774]|uniref:RNA polymerase sigma factor RpoS n=1 Tax=Acaryochloris thomasi RCC1774 TaxID=1764569 RepID=A0A2W1JFI7_9CYAN|nr:sigma-70 family RNA polymerase sigma factor [Acaryochloris thomasi]PZD70455.1 RNA polymerase sigma factor RpoS [Acaryochloris thomasi RCC1774]